MSGSAPRSLTRSPDRVVVQPSEDIGQPGERIDVVELGGLDERVDGGGAAAALV